MTLLDEDDRGGAGPDPETRGWFLGQVLKRFSDDPLIYNIEWDWDRLTLRRIVPLCGGWIPKIHCDERTILLPASVGHNAATIGDAMEGIGSLTELFEAFGTAASPRTACG